MGLTLLLPRCHGLRRLLGYFLVIHLLLVHIQVGSRVEMNLSVFKLPL
jgi:hypothetical protein